jgi:hypothetical protein
MGCLLWGNHERKVSWFECDQAQLELLVVRGLGRCWGSWWKRGPHSVKYSGVRQEILDCHKRVVSLGAGYAATRRKGC